MKNSQVISDIEENIRRNLKGKGIVACSGGLDSTVLSVIASKAFPERILVVFVDTGLLRKNESDSVRKLFAEQGLNFKILNAEERFFRALKGKTDPEEKRKIIGSLFIDIFNEEAERFGCEYLLQGTIAPDWIESGGGVRDNIKSHHNVGGLPKNMKLKLIEPLRDLYKDEIREISHSLGIDRYRQPFPGPGLAIRVIGEVTKERVELVRYATYIVEDEVRKYYSDPEELPWQYFAVLLPVQSTGIMGDRRTYGYTIAIRIFDSLDAMSGTFRKVPWDLLESISLRITNSVKGINRVVYDVTSKPPGTIEWE